MFLELWQKTWALSSGRETQDLITSSRPLVSMTEAQQAPSVWHVKLVCSHSWHTHFRPEREVPAFVSRAWEDRPPHGDRASLPCQPTPMDGLRGCGRQLIPGGRRQHGSPAPPDNTFLKQVVLSHREVHSICLAWCGRLTTQGAPACCLGGQTEVQVFRFTLSAPTGSGQHPRQHSGQTRGHVLHPQMCI